MTARLVYPHEYPYHIVNLYSQSELSASYLEGIKELKEKQPKEKLFEKVERYIDMLNKDLANAN